MRKNVSFFLLFLVKVNYQPVTFMIIIDQVNKNLNVWKSLNSGTVYAKLSQLNNVKFFLEVRDV